MPILQNFSHETFKSVKIGFVHIRILNTLFVFIFVIWRIKKIENRRMPCIRWIKFKVCQKQSHSLGHHLCDGVRSVKFKILYHLNSLTVNGMMKWSHNSSYLPIFIMQFLLKIHEKWEWCRRKQYENCEWHVMIMLFFYLVLVAQYAGSKWTILLILFMKLLKLIEPTER